VLPPDLLFDVLLRLPAKELCRLRAVCRSWRSLTFDPLFVGEHAARHPLFLANFRDDRARVHVVDLSGNVVKVIPNPDGDRLLPTRLDLACAATAVHIFRIWEDWRYRRVQGATDVQLAQVPFPAMHSGGRGRAMRNSSTQAAPSSLVRWSASRWILYAMI